MNLHKLEQTMECDKEEAQKIEMLLLDTLEKQVGESENPVTVIVGLMNALLTVTTRLNFQKASFFDFLDQGWEQYRELAKEERIESRERLH